MPGRYWCFVLLLLCIFQIACTSGKGGYVGKRHKQRDSIRGDFNAVTSFDDLSKKRYGDQYRKMFEELDLNNADTVVFFARPCYTHYGIVLKVNNRRYKAYYFSFTRGKEEVKLITKSRRDVREYLSFFYAKDTLNVTSCPERVVWVSHPCPLLISAKMGSRFHQMEMEEHVESCFLERSTSFRKMHSKLRRDIDRSR